MFLLRYKGHSGWCCQAVHIKFPSVNKLILDYKLTDMSKIMALS